MMMMMMMTDIDQQGWHTVEDQLRTNSPFGVIFHLMLYKMMMMMVMMMMIMLTVMMMIDTAYSCGNLLYLIHSADIGSIYPSF